MIDRSRLITSALIVAGFFAFAHGGLAGQSVQTICESTTWSNCGVAVKHELEKNPSDPKKIIEIAMAWGKAYNVRYNELRTKGRIVSATPDSDKIFEAINSKLNPLEVAKDKTVDALVKKYLSQLAPVLEWAGSPLAEALKAFFDSSEIATDYDELKLMNNDIQLKVATLMQPFFKPDWKDTLKKAVQEAAPQLRKP
jgi:hypothetical protein